MKKMTLVIAMMLWLGSIASSKCTYKFSKRTTLDQKLAVSKLVNKGFFYTEGIADYIVDITVREGMIGNGGNTADVLVINPHTKTIVASERATSHLERSVLILGTLGLAALFEAPGKYVMAKAIRKLPKCEKIKALDL